MLSEGISELMRRLAMSSSDQDKQRNREIAENEANRQVIGDVRVSVWAIAVTVVAGLCSASPGRGSTAENCLSDHLA